MSFLGGFEGRVGLGHLPEGDYSTESYPAKKKFKGRVLGVDVANKAIELTLQDQLVTGEAFSFGDVEIGDTFHGTPYLKCVCMWCHLPLFH